MKKSKKINRYKLSWYIHFILFVLATIILWIMRIKTYNTWLADINKTEYDPLWELIYLYFFMPLISLIYWISEWWKKYRYIIPIIACLAGFFLYIFASDWWEYSWETIPLITIIPTWVPSLITTLIWIWIIRIILAIIKPIKNNTNKIDIK
jgi:hypothetical protein